MNLLPDTHILLWWLAGDRRLPSGARALLGNSANAVTVSVVSLWEIAIKSGKRKLRADLGEIEDAIEQSGFSVLPIHARHVVQYTSLPRHHDDPFDRMLIAQARSETLRLVTHDPALRRYGEAVEIV